MSDVVNVIRNFDFKRIIGLYIAPALFIFIVFFVELEPANPSVSYTLAVAILMALWWITEVIPIAITSLLPVVLFPLLGVMDGKEVSSAYFNHVIFLFIGGFIVALAMQKWDLHKRIALKILSFTGTSPSKILLGFMLASAFLSMWISNTATAMMMVPILLSIIVKLEDILEPEDLRKYSIGLLLGVAYGSSIGGIATLVGTPPNLSFVRIMQIMFPEAPEVSFSSWFVFAMPLSIIFFIIIWLFLKHRFKPKVSKGIMTGVAFKEQYKKLGKASFEERSILSVFIALIVLWLTRNGLDLGNFSIPGWGDLFSQPNYINDGTVAISLAIILFLIPSREKKGKMIMNWKTTSRLPWNIVLLFGGGFALASGFKESGLSIWFGEELSSIESLHPILIVLIISFVVTFLTEFTSNTATIEILLPVLAGLALTIGVNPLLLMLPATISASMAFMLPVATPPNAIIFGTNKIRILDMARTGLILNLIGILLVTLLTYFWAPLVFDYDPTILPPWAH
jgi:sodium-dependent dicarboxylate transporter 2/3/5